jgi:hypothetical protein
MPFAPARTYRARIGGLIYRDVPHPIVVDGKPILTLARDSESGHLGVTFELRRQAGESIASVVNNSATVQADGFVLVQQSRRSALIEVTTGRVWFDLKTAPIFDDCELELSCIWFGKGGNGVLLHPDRTKIGVANDDKPPNISLLTLTTEPGSSGTGIGVTGGGLYLLGLAIEHFQNGISIQTKPDGSKSSG